MISLRHNLLQTLRRQGFERVPVDFWLCESQIESFRDRFGHPDYPSYFGMSHRRIEMKVKRNYEEGRELYKREKLPDDIEFDEYGIGHSKGSELAYHMTRMHHPLQGADLKEILDYPYPAVDQEEELKVKSFIKELHSNGIASFAFMQMTVWEASWYLRSLEELMMDMMMDSEKAEVLLNKITDFACAKAEAYANSGVDILSLGDDIGTQNSIMIDINLWEKWLKPRLSKVIDTARNIKPDILVFYHSCGYIVPFIDGLIEVGIDILNPIQPECMSFDDVHEKYGEQLSFWGTIGTQKLLPYGKAEEVKHETISRLQICGEKGGIVIGPTHIVEPEVPWANLMAIMEGVQEFEKNI